MLLYLTSISFSTLAGISEGKTEKDIGLDISVDSYAKMLTDMFSRTKH